MCAIKVNGINNSKGLRGSVDIQGCKNSALPILAATLLNGKTNVIHNCPYLSDVVASVDILNSLGCSAQLHDGIAFVDTAGLISYAIGEQLMGAMRSSVLFAGALLSRCGIAEFTMPGGCDIGLRPIDIHLAAFEKMGVDVECNDGNVVCRADSLHGADIHLPIPSVGATENIMLLAVKGRGVTRIYNAAREPEICDLQSFLNSMGARISGAGTGVITIYPVGELDHSCYRIMPDRIEALTFACACATAGGNILLNNVECGHISAPASILRMMGVTVVEYSHAMLVASRDSIHCLPMISTGPYPAFPTDAQSLFMSVMSGACGEGNIVENIFENRFGHASELIRMGADIKIDGRIAHISGGRLRGAETYACDLRSGAALVVAGLGAEGETIVHNSRYIDRGYDGFVQKLCGLGACAERI